MEDRNKIREFRAVFKYEADFRRPENYLELLARLDKYEFDPTFWVTSTKPDLDYVLLKLKPLRNEPVSEPFDKVDLAKTLEGVVVPLVTTQTLATDSDLQTSIESEFLTLIETKDFIAPDPIHMIQHPGGRPKQVVVFNNRLVNVYENFIEYDTDAEPGSSGSPLFNTEWQVVGIHQAALIDIDENSNERKVKGYLGIRMDCILADLREQSSSNPELQDFVEKYIDGTIPPTQPQVFILAGRKRDSVLGKNYAELEQKAMENLRQSIIVQMNRLAPDVRVVPISGNPEQSDWEALKLAIQDINKQRNPEQQNELAIELLVNNSDTYSYVKSSDSYSFVNSVDTYSSKNFSIKLYYKAGNVRAQQLAQLLQKVLQEDNPSFSVRAFPDSYTNTRGLMFCRDVNLPAVVIFVGDLANASDRKFLEKLQQDSTTAKALTSSLIQGIRTALNELKTR